MSSTKSCVDLHVRINTREKGGVQIDEDEVDVDNEWDSEGEKESRGVVRRQTRDDEHANTFL